MLPWFQRACLLVRDIPASQRLYRDVLGFSVTEPRWHRDPERGPARGEAAIYDPDGHPAVVYEILDSGP